MRITVITKKGVSTYNGDVDNMPLNASAVQKRGETIYRQLCPQKIAAVEKLLREEFIKTAVSCAGYGKKFDWNDLPGKVLEAVKINDAEYFILAAE